MAKQRGIVEDVLAPLLSQLSTAERFLPKSNSISQPDPLLEKIKRDLQDTKSLFQQSDSRETEFINKFEAVSRHVDDLLHSAKLQDPATQERLPHHQPMTEYRAKLEAIDQAISEVKERLPSFLLWPAEPAPMEDPKASDEGQEVQGGEILKEREAMSDLSSRMETLDNQLKACLFSFTAFQEGEVIKKRLLIHWWIGEGLVSPSDWRTAEENGELRVKELIFNRLIEPSYHKWSSEVIGCKMYQWIYRFLISSNARIAYFSPFRRVCLSETNQELNSTGSDQQQLLTLYNISNKYLRFEKDWFIGKKRLNVVQLGRWQDLPKHHIEVDSTGFLQGLENCINLKYLSLRGISRITELPNSISKLSKLIILDLRACHNLEKLNVAITSLTKLTHLDVSECYLLEHMPKGLGSLSALQVLKGFVVCNARSKNPCRLTELRKLEKLRKLSISIGHDSMLSKDEFRAFVHFKALRSLTIRWTVVHQLIPQGRPQLKRIQTMNNFSISPPPNLQKLDLRCFPNHQFLDWMKPEKLGSLKKLYIRGGQLVSLSKETGWKVEVLRLKCLNHLNLAWESLHDAFRDLACLQVWKCANTTSFRVDEGGFWTKEMQDGREGT